RDQRQETARPRRRLGHPQRPRRQAGQAEAVPDGQRVAMSLSPEQIGWVAHLARLELSPADRDLMARQLSAILDYMDQLKQLNTDGVEPLAHPLHVHTVYSGDAP